VTSARLRYLSQKSANRYSDSIAAATMRADWFAQNLPYALSKYGMSMVMFGMAEEFKADGIACNSLWPRTTIATAAVEFALGGEAMLKQSRSPAVMRTPRTPF